MKITGIQIERFGAWQKFSQTLHPAGLTVFYGPNEAGKTTLLRFIRGVLYGFPADDGISSARNSRKLPRAGSLTIEHRGQSYEIRRASHGDEPGLLSISGVSGHESTDRLLADLLAGTDEKLFESVFAVGLPELQQFATLNEAEVARHLYGMTLGPQGQVLMELPDRIEQELRGLWNETRQDGLLPSLLKKWDEHGKASQVPRGQRDRHRQLRTRQRELETEINRQRQLQSNLQLNLRGLAFLEKLSAPYRRLMQQQTELQSLPDFSKFPADGVQRVERLDTELTTLDQHLGVMDRELGGMRQTLRAAKSWPEIRRQARAVQRLSQLREALDVTAPRGPELQQELAREEARGKAALNQLGRGWSIERIEKLAWPADIELRLVDAARSYEAIRQRVGRQHRRYRRASLKCRDRELSIRTLLYSLGVSTPDSHEPLESARARLKELLELGRLQLAATELKYRTVGIDEQLQRLRDRAGLPDWVYGVLGLFLLGGLGLVVAGIVGGVTTGWLVGLIYVVLALLAGGTTWALKLQYEQDLQEEVGRLREYRRENDTQRLELETRLAALVQSELRPDPNEPRFDPEQLMAKAAQRMADLELAERDWLAIQGIRRKLSLYRQRLQVGQKERSHARQQWCQMVRSLGLDEALDVPAVLAQVAHVRDATRSRSQVARLKEESVAWTQARQMFNKQVTDLATRMQRPLEKGITTEAASRQWDAELQELLARRREARHFLDDYRRRQAEYSRQQKVRVDLDQQRSKLLSLVGATDRSVFKDRLGLMERRRQLLRQIDQTNEELQSIVRLEPELAMIESDLEQYEPSRHVQKVKQTQRDLEKLDGDLQALHEEVGTVKQELKTLESDRSESRWRFERVQLESQIRRGLERFFAAQVAQNAVENISVRFEKANQPEMLAAAMPFLQRLTCQKYHHLWTSLSRRRLFVDDDRGQSLPAEVLSGGTREQLFLSIRLAMVRAFSRQGIELPMVLDDVTVNFDHQRSEAAADTFQDFAKEGQQVLVFTSHQHFAEMFQRRGLEPVFLPARDASGLPMEERLAG